MSQHTGGLLPEHIPDEPAHFYLLTTYLSYMILTVFGRTRANFGKIVRPEKHKDFKERGG
tara:strand:+ start:301 stop:480 length:180 start_codon:yes stop_codon:yes gene_type:complete